ncbi:MAG: polyphenol oxidase family protein [Spirochaetales bacterium]|uniref:Polyphenol oxidase family protein n=1 Tax=Candidatus Thalassospirochaeta sargassi TaxID=3119039 RepID=A0AAJ1IIV7_9SPIO|nr:polyphenol oxidase family protein [Spirochaetales bacterium]
MVNIDELLEINGYRLVMTNLDAGPMGPSWDRFNPNRVNALKGIGLEASEVYFVRQQHTKEIVSTEEWLAHPLTEADGLISRRSPDSIAVTVADCMPVYLHDRKKDVRAILHSGWKGTGIAEKALERMVREYGCMAADVTAVLGPAIGACCYNVDNDRADFFRNTWGADSVEKRGGKNYISLRKANIAMLEKAGISEIVSVDKCTACSSALGSFRREGAGTFTQMFCLSYRK